MEDEKSVFFEVYTFQEYLRTSTIRSMVSTKQHFIISKDNPVRFFKIN